MNEDELKRGAMFDGLLSSEIVSLFTSQILRNSDLDKEEEEVVEEATLSLDGYRKEDLQDAIEKIFSSGFQPEELVEYLIELRRDDIRNRERDLSTDLDNLMDDHQKALRRIEDLEKIIEEHVMAKVKRDKETVDIMASSL